MDLSESLKALMTEKITPFQNSGECSDEAVLCFDNGKKLYVSRNFLCYASPVFKAMFQHDMKTDGKEVDMTGKVYDDFLELLLCLHPGVEKTVDRSNVLRIVSLAKEYKIQTFEKRCQKAMMIWLSSEIDLAVNKDGNAKRVQNAQTCLIILIKAVCLGYKDVVTHAIEVVSRFGYDVFTGETKKAVFNFGVPQPFVFGKKDEISDKKLTTDFSANLTSTTDDKTNHPTDGCKKLFDSLSEEIKSRILLQRLKLCDDCSMRKMIGGRSFVTNPSSK